MNWKHRIRQIHRWLSIAFTVTVLANIVALAAGTGEQPPAWVTYAPLLPLVLLLLSGLYLFVLPYMSRSRSAAVVPAGASQPARNLEQGEI
jgi:hypothetical protein